MLKKSNRMFPNNTLFVPDSLPEWIRHFILPDFFFYLSLKKSYDEFDIFLAKAYFNFTDDK